MPVAEVYICGEDPRYYRITPKQGEVVRVFERALRGGEGVKDEIAKAAEKYLQKVTGTSGAPTPHGAVRIIEEN